ncbi:HEPN domain-containing protein [Colwellia sp. 20A7]|uniref:HEPN domain-containing protein n=1 Tax=Colwellia sp. 20A7 TaxID=2689569 RepID=UPI001EECA944|nr:HEPN domain-containing protein [Colwellia sp. 20A7]
MINLHLATVVKPSGISSKEFIYTNSIISLYGYLESFLQKLAEEFITSINEASIPVSALPKAIKERHLELSMQFLTKIGKDRNQDDSVKKNCEKQVIENLHSFLQETNEYSLNSKAFSAHTANFRYELIQSYFAQVGVSHIAYRTLGFDNVTNQLALRQQQETTENKSALKNWLEYELGELAQLRNEIAHGSFERSIESFDLIIERASFLRHFGVALASILYRSFEEIVFHGKARFVIGTADRAFPLQSSFGFVGKAINVDEEQFTIKIGDEIFAHNKSTGSKVISGVVSSLMLGGKRSDEVVVPSEQDFSIKVDFEISNSMTNRELSITRRTGVS